jgi:hypothetical protein
MDSNKTIIQEYKSYSEKAQWVLNHLGYDVQEKTIMWG